MTGISKLAMIITLGGAAWAGEKYTEEQFNARFYYDLGPTEIDVAAYPKKQQANYAVFKRTCSQCHSLARPINAPIARRKDWQRYVNRMKLRTEARPQVVMTKADNEAVVEFLAYDSKARKAARRKEFEAETERLEALYADMARERSGRQQEEGKKEARPEYPYTGTK